MPVYQLTLFIIYFSVSSAAKNNCVNLCESVKSVVKFSSRLGAFVAETQLVRRSLLVRHSFPVLRSFSEGGSDGGGEGGSIKND
jgi:hypothetical protein